METNKELITDAQIEQAALKHVAPLFGSGDYRQTEQFSRLKAFTAELLALFQRSEAVFPPRDTTKPAEQQGLFNKFNVQRTDGSDVFGKKHFGCKYFVLDLDHDAHAGAAMRAYAQSCRTTHPALADDIEAMTGRSEAVPQNEILSAVKDFYSLYKRTVVSECVPMEEIRMAAAIKALEAAPAPSAAAGEQVQEIKRYEMAVRYDKYACEDVADPVEADDGDWVRYSDVCAALAAQPTPVQGGAVLVGYISALALDRLKSGRHAAISQRNDGGKIPLFVEQPTANTARQISTDTVDAARLVGTIQLMPNPYKAQPHLAIYVSAYDKAIADVVEAIKGELATKKKGGVA